VTTLAAILKLLWMLIAVGMSSLILICISIVLVVIIEALRRAKEEN